jgi:hypothetical protein
MKTNRQLEDWIQAWLFYNSNSEPPILYHHWVAISIIAAALQRKCRLDWGSLTFYPNMYIILVGPSGARKGTAMGPGLKVLKELRIKTAAEATTREALIQTLRECTDTVHDTKEGTFEAHSSITIFSPEFTCFLGYDNKQLMSDLCDWYDCRDEWTYRTKNMGTDEITGVFVNIIGGTTPDLIRTTMPLEAVGSGLTSRMIFVYEHGKLAKVPCPFKSNEQLAIYPKLMADIEEIRMLHGNFQVTREFIKVWNEWYLSMPDECPFDAQRFAGYWERRANHIMKLSMIHNVARTSTMLINETDLRNSIHLLERTEKKMPMTFGGVGRHQLSDVVQRIMGFIAVKKRTSHKEILSEFYRDVSDWDLNKIEETLVRMEFIDISRSPTDTTIELREKNESDNSTADDHC